MYPHFVVTSHPNEKLKQIYLSRFRVFLSGTIINLSILSNNLSVIFDILTARQISNFTRLK